MKELIELNSKFQTANDDEPPGDPRRLYALALQPGEGHTAGKTHLFDKGRRVDDDSHGAGSKFWPIRTEPIDGIEDLAEHVEAMADTEAMIPIRAHTAEWIEYPKDLDGAQLGDDLVRAKRRGRLADWKRRRAGERFFMFDLDGLEAPDWFPEDPSPEDLVRGVEYAREQLPPPFRDVSCHYQWSASAGIDGLATEDEEGTGKITWPKLNLHLWFWLDRPALSYISDDKPLKKHTLKGYFERWNERLEAGEVEGTEIDPSTTGAVHKHYIAPPTFEGTDADGEPITDHLEGLRSGMLEGEYDTVEVPDEILPPDRFLEALEEHQQREEKKREERERKVDAERLEIDEDRITDAARATLDQACEEIREATEGSRHDTMVSRVHAVYGYVNGGDLDDETAEERLVEAFVDAAGEPRRSEAERAIRGSREEGHTIDRSRFTRPTYTPPEDRSPPDELIEVESVDEGREALSEVVDRRMDRGGISLISVAPGVGKSFSAKDLAIDVLADGGSVRYGAPSHDGLDEVQDDFEEMINGREDLSIADRGKLKKAISARPTRDGKENCTQIEPYNFMNKKSPDGGIEYCMGCAENPHTNGGDCPYWEALDDHRGADLELSTLHVNGFDAMREAPEAEEKQIRVDWSTIERLIGRRVPCRIVLRETAKTYRITAEREPSGDPFPAYPDDRAIHHNEDRRHAVTLQYISDRFDCGPKREDIAGRLLEMDRVRADCELAILDESALDIVKTEPALARADIRQMREDGEIDLDAETERDLIDLIADTNEDDQTIRADEIGEIISADEIEVCPEGEYPGAEGVTDPDEAMKLRDWEALDGLRQAVRNDWAGAYISDGKLHVTYVRDIPWHRLARTVLVLDATATPDQARAIYGDDLHYTEITVPVDAVETVHVPYNASKNKTRDGEFQSDRGRDLWTAAHTRWDSSSALHITHKPWREDDPDEDASEPAHVLADCDGAAIHFGGTKARGSNEFADCETVIVDSLHWHSGAIDSTAFALCELAGDDWTDDEDRDRWTLEARHGEEISKVRQAIHRVRPVHADRGNPVRIIFLDRRDPEIFGPEFSVDREIHPDELVADFFQKYRRRVGARIFLGEITQIAPEKILIPALIEDAEPGQSGADPHEHWLGYRTDDKRPHNIHAECHECVTQDRLENFLRRHFNGDWEKYADETGLEFAQVKTSAGGGDRVVISSKEITPTRLRSALEKYDHDLTWVEVDSERIDLVGVEAKLRSALAAIERSDFPNLSARKKQKLVGEQLGASGQTVRKSRMQSVDWSTGDLVDAWREEHGIIKIDRHEWFDYQPAPEMVIGEETDEMDLEYISDEEPADEYATPYSDPEPRSDYVRPYMTPLEFNGAAREPFEREDQKSDWTAPAIARIEYRDLPEDLHLKFFDRHSVRVAA